MLFYLKIFISIITIIGTVSDDLYLPNSLLNNQVLTKEIIVRKRRERRPKREKRKPTESQQKKSSCPEKSEDLEILVAALMLDLPGYINREIQRDRQADKDYLKRNIIVAGRPEFEPLPIDYTPFIQENIHQVFLTTLERQYVNNQAVEVQEFHWLFMRRTDIGWELVNMFSIAENLASQPEDSSNGVVAKGIRAWLQGCHFISVTRALSPSP